ncbi:hypothetical protein BU15DRAFT_68284 [Melanogaster broomeanus]|nr:hypothetical protein BU15DRAFT_68284 [Melanogaster broomeanus]
MESNALVKKVRLMYIAFEGILIVKLPGSVHEVPLIIIWEFACLSGRWLKPEFLCIGECTFSQDKETLLKKLQLEIDACLEIMMAVMIILTETSLYHSPKEDSTGWHTFCCHSKCCSFEEFLDMIKITDKDSKWLGPIMVANHTWYHISNVDYKQFSIMVNAFWMGTFVKL